MTYVVEMPQDFKLWGKLETIKGVGKQVKFIDPRLPIVTLKGTSTGSSWWSNKLT